MLALKRIGFSMDEIRAMPMARFLVFCDLLAEERRRDEASSDGVRDATQADIDAFLG